MQSFGIESNSVDSRISDVNVAEMQTVSRSTSVNSVDRTINHKGLSIIDLMRLMRVEAVEKMDVEEEPVVVNDDNTNDSNDDSNDDNNDDSNDDLIFKMDEDTDRITSVLSSDNTPYEVYKISNIGISFIHKNSSPLTHYHQIESNVMYADDDD
jgi:hypothetical protein